MAEDPPGEGLDGGDPVGPTPPGADPAPGGSTTRPLRDELLLVAELAAVVGFAIVSPVLGPFGESPESFVSADASSRDIVTFAVLVALVPLAVIGAVAAASRVFGPRVRSWVQTGLVSVLAAMAGVVVVRKLDVAWPVRWLVALVVLGGVAWVHRRWEPGRSFLRFASPAPLLFLVLFLFASSATPLIRSSDGADARGDAAAGTPSVVMIVLDELPTRSLVEHGEIDADQFPNLARFAATSTWYRNSTTVADATVRAVPSLVSGRRDGGGPIAEEDPESIFTLLAPTHDVHSVEWTTELCPRSVCDDQTTGIDDDAATLLADPIEDQAAPLRDLAGEASSLWWQQAVPWAGPLPERNDAVGLDTSAAAAGPGLEFLSSLTDAGDGSPRFDYVHTPVPHQPWILLPNGATYRAPKVELTSPETVGSEVGEDQALAARARHLLQVQWADRLLGAIIDRLQEQDRWDDSVVVLAADHGTSFSPFGVGRDLTPENEAEVAWAPLMIKAPGQSVGEVRDDNVMTIDVVPTVADLVGVQIPWAVDGMSLAGDARRTDPTKSVRVKKGRKTHPGAGTDGFATLTADGLAAILDAPDRPGAPDELQLWRHGRHGDLLGRSVDELGACGNGPSLAYHLTKNWRTYGTPRQRLPLWHTGMIQDDGSRDVAAVIDGTVVGWGVSDPRPEGNQFEILLTEPLLGDSPEVPTFYEIVADDGCRLRPMAFDR